MSFAATLTAGLAVFAFGTAIFNLWIYWMRPREPSYLWLGVTSIGVTWIAAGFASSYGAETLDEAQQAALLALGGALPFTAGLIRFSELFAGIRHPLLRACIPYAALVTGATFAKPSLFFSGVGAAVSPPFGPAYIQPSLTPTAGFVYLGFGAAIAGLVVAYGRRAATLERGGMIARAHAFWAACMVNDMCVGFGLYWGPWLLPFGFAAFSSVFGALLLRRLVHSQGSVERSAGELYSLVEARTDELRRKDLELAHGARLATLGALAGGIAHEVAEPLAAIDARVKELRHAWNDASRPGAFTVLLDESQRSVERIRVVVAELLRLARREEGQRGLHELRAIVAGVLPIAGYELRRRARLETRLASAPAVSGDAAMLSQIALNLLVGAIHAFPENAAPGNALVSLTTETHEGCARLVVEDNAPSRASDGAGDLFELGGELAGEFERRVGLAVTKQLVERHGGILEFESGAAGTRVAVVFPAAPPDRTPS